MGEDFNEEKYFGMHLSKRVMSTLAFYVAIIVVIQMVVVTFFCLKNGKIDFDDYLSSNEFIIGTLLIFAAGGMATLSIQRLYDKRKKNNSSSSGSSSGIDSE